MGEDIELTTGGILFLVAGGTGIGVSLSTSAGTLLGTLSAIGFGLGSFLLGILVGREQE